MRNTIYSLLTARYADFRAKVGIGNVGAQTGSAAVLTALAAANKTALKVAVVDGEVIAPSGILMTALPNYADNTAALAGGLVAGRFYRTAGDLKIVT